MSVKLRVSGIILILLAVAALSMSAAFLYEGFSKQMFIEGAMRTENITLSSLGVKGPNSGLVIQNAETAQIAADKVRADRHLISPSYGALMAGGKYDPTNPEHLAYAQALNLENYLYMAVLGLGVTTLAEAIGGGFLVIALALGVTGYSFLVLAKK
ncbi:MAG: hypothetical protein ABSB31_00035 [Dehalococcoidia bacterium]|jgi:hypothetical protein